MKRVLSLIISLALILVSLPAMAEGELAITSPVGGTSFFGDESINFMIANGNGAQCYVDGELVGNVADDMFTLSTDTIGRGKHTFKAVLDDAEASVSFSFYEIQTTFLANDFNAISSGVGSEVGAAQIREGATGQTDGWWTWNSMKTYITTGEDGLKALNCKGTDGNYPSLWVIMDGTFFGRDTSTGRVLKTGVVVTEFDIKMNEYSCAGVIGGGIGPWNGNSYNSGKFRSDGKIGNTTYELGEWGHYKQVVDLDNDLYYVYYNGQLVDSGETTSDFGLLEYDMSMVRIMGGQSGSDEPVDFDLDNVKFSLIETGTMKIKSPVSGLSFFGDETITFEIENGDRARCFVDDELVGRCSNGAFVLSTDNLTSGNHTFKAVMGEEEVSIDFDFYANKFTFLTNDFNAIPNGVGESVGAAQVNLGGAGQTSGWWPWNNMSFKMTTGEDGSKALNCTGTDSSYPTLWVIMDNTFFGKDTANNRSLREGVAIVEFDVRMNEYTNLGVLCGGIGDLSSNAYNTGFFRSNGVIGTTTYELGEWGHYKHVVDLNADAYYIYYNDEIVASGTASGDFSLVEYDMSMVRIQAGLGGSSEAVDFDLDNIKFSVADNYYVAIASDFSDSSIDGCFVPRAYVPIMNTGSDEKIERVADKNGAPNGAWKFTPMSNGTLTPRIYLQNRGTKGVTTGVFEAGFDVKFDSTNVRVALAEGWGIDGWTARPGDIFYGGKFFGKVPVEADIWYNVRFVADFDMGKFHAYLDGAYVGSTPITEALMPNEYAALQIRTPHFYEYGFDQTEDEFINEKGVTLDNISFIYNKTLPRLASVKAEADGAYVDVEGYVVPKGTEAVKFTMTTAFPADAVDASRVTAFSDNSPIAISGVVQNGKEITVTFAEPVNGDDLKIMIDDTTPISAQRTLPKAMMFTFETVAYGFGDLELTTDGTNATVYVSGNFNTAVAKHLLAIASYDGDKLVGVNVTAIELENGGQDTWSATVKDADDVRAFLWTADCKPVKMIIK